MSTRPAIDKTLLENWQRLVASLNTGLNKLQNPTRRPVNDDEDEYEDEDESERASARLLQLLKRSCQLVRHAESINHPNLNEIIEEVAKFQSSGVSAAYSRREWFDFLPSYAHTDASPLINDGNNSGLGM